MKTEKKEKPTPVNCVCGRPAVLVKTKHGKMFSCPNPMGCEANLRTEWLRNEEVAVVEWNTLIQSYIQRKKEKNNGF